MTSIPTHADSGLSSWSLGLLLFTWAVLGGVGCSHGHCTSSHVESHEGSVQCLGYYDNGQCRSTYTPQIQETICDDYRCDDGYYPSTNGKGCISREESDQELQESQEQAARKALEDEKMRPIREAQVRQAREEQERTQQEAKHLALDQLNGVGLPQTQTETVDLSSSGFPGVLIDLPVNSRYEPPKPTIAAAFPTGVFVDQKGRVLLALKDASHESAQFLLSLPYVSSSVVPQPKEILREPNLVVYEGSFQQQKHLGYVANLGRVTIHCWCDTYEEKRLHRIKGYGISMG
jgi:hypothetical protein